ncbi:MAG: hypothetical protein HRT54_07955 [Colwellia sp.]|nr:hypothetical protein [Colwellia sp.]
MALYSKGVLALLSLILASPLTFAESQLDRNMKSLFPEKLKDGKGEKMILSDKESKHINRQISIKMGYYSPERTCSADINHSKMGSGRKYYEWTRKGYRACSLIIGHAVEFCAIAQLTSGKRSPYSTVFYEESDGWVIELSESMYNDPKIRQTMTVNCLVSD